MELKFKAGDKVNCTAEGKDFALWQNATIIEADPIWEHFPYVCACDAYPNEKGLFAENELELVDE